MYGDTSLECRVCSVIGMVLAVYMFIVVPEACNRTNSVTIDPNPVISIRKSYNGYDITLKNIGSSIRIDTKDIAFLHDGRAGPNYWIGEYNQNDTFRVVNNTSILQFGDMIWLDEFGYDLASLHPVLYDQYMLRNSTEYEQYNRANLLDRGNGNYSVLFNMTNMSNISDTYEYIYYTILNGIWDRPYILEYKDDTAICTIHHWNPYMCIKIKDYVCAYNYTTFGQFRRVEKYNNMVLESYRHDFLKGTGQQVSFIHRAPPNFREKTYVLNINF